MKADLTIANSNSDGWDAVPLGADSLIRGKLIKFNSEGRFVCGDADVSNDQLVVTGVVTCWVRWGDEGKPAETRRTHPGEAHPTRAELPNQDQSEWPLGPDGRPCDPWVDCRYLYLLDRETAAEFTFTTHTWGGRKATSDLSRQIQILRRNHPKATPIVRLDAEKMKTRFGPKPKPVFTVTDCLGLLEPVRLAATSAVDRGDEGHFSPSPSEDIPF